VDEGQLARFREALGVLEKAGARIVEVDLPHLPHAIATYYIVATAEASSNLARFDGVRYGLRVDGARGKKSDDTGVARDLKAMYGATRDAGFGPEVKRRILLGTFALSAGYSDAFYEKAMRVRRLIANDFARAFEKCDVVVSPTSPVPAFRLGEKTDDPCRCIRRRLHRAREPGRDPRPVDPLRFHGGAGGLQLLAPFDEEALLRLGAAYQAETDHHRHSPPL
jgi:aspartyl-tRNA(Asn)/glutamyl-tRNA(Gln) amidotransferase subunit A